MKVILGLIYTIAVEGPIIHRLGQLPIVLRTQIGHGRLMMVTKLYFQNDHFSISDFSPIWPKHCFTIYKPLKLLTDSIRKYDKKQVFNQPLSFSKRKFSYHICVACSFRLRIFFSHDLTRVRSASVSSFPMSRGNCSSGQVRLSSGEPPNCVSMKGRRLAFT